MIALTEFMNMSVGEDGGSARHKPAFQGFPVSSAEFLMVSAEVF